MATAFFRQNPALIPLILAAAGGVTAGITYAGYTLVKSPEVVISRFGPQQPWNNIKQHENPKLITINKQFFESRKGIETPSKSF
ncbi:14620_t:CDS:2 [Funneliformis caledonium]|uniref:14620_t:CDS:1 n=1 Tax=Funneliformis caledonium TaxID=1117310 RepID=A0A9N9FNE7_9GLOM|nr:14620_t:CDS:2 [Funneliformis caledonium]